MNYEVAPFPLNNPLTPTTLEVHASVLCTACVFVKIYKDSLAKS